MNRPEERVSEGGETKGMSHFFLDYVDEIPTMEGKVAVLFEGFFKNKMQNVVGVLSNPGVPRNPEAIKRMIQNVEDIYHHFCPRDHYHEDLFEELIQILKTYPRISRRAQALGFSHLREIFKIFNYELDLGKRKIESQVKNLQK